MSEIEDAEARFLGVALPHYDRGQQHWPRAWILPEVFDDGGDLFDKMAWLADDIHLREAVHLWDNVFRLPDALGGILGGMLSAHARMLVGSGVFAGDVEKAADAVREGWLGMARQAVALSNGELDPPHD